MPSYEFELIEAAAALAEALDGRPFLQRHRDSKLGSASRKMIRVARARFRAQKLAVTKPSVLKPFSAREAIAETDEQRRARIVAQAQAALGPLLDRVPVSTADANVFDGSIRAAITAGEEGVQHIMGAAAADTESFVSNYLRQNGFTKLTGDLDQTTLDRLANAVADAYEDGADYDQVVKAIRTEFSDFNSTRAEMIAQTELNDAYNQSVLHFGEEAGATKKSWQTDLAPCPICIANALQGAIDIGESFDSGDDAAPAHPNCLCTVMVEA